MPTTLVQTVKPVSNDIITSSYITARNLFSNKSAQVVCIVLKLIDEPERNFGKTFHIACPIIDVSIPVSLVIKDSADNIVWELKDDSNFPREFVSHQLIISSQANLGMWSLQMFPNAQRYSTVNAIYEKQFKVGATSASRFSIQIMPVYKYVEYKNPRRYNATLKVGVSAVYDSGANVNGRGDMTVKIVDDCGNELFPVQTSEFETHGYLTTILLDVTNIIAKNKDLRDCGGNFEIRITVTDKFTGEANTKCVTTSFSKNGYRIQEFSSFRVRRPGLPFFAEFRLLDQAGNIAKQNDKYEFRPHLGKSNANFQDGIGNIRITGNELSYYRISSGTISLVRHISNITHEAPHYLQIRLLQMATNEISQNASFKVHVMSTVAIDVAHMVILSSGEAILSDSRYPNSTDFIIESRFPENSGPEATLVVFANVSNIVVSDAITLKVANWRQHTSNDVGLWVSQNAVEPGENISVSIKAKPGSVVYLRAEEGVLEDYPDEFAAYNWLNLELQSNNTDELEIRDGMTSNEIGRVLANRAILKKVTDENPACIDKPKSNDKRRRVLISKIIKITGAVTTELLLAPDIRSTWRIKGFVVEKKPGTGHHIKTLPTVLVKIQKPLTILMELPSTVVQNEEIKAAVLLRNTFEHNVDSVRIVTKLNDAPVSKDQNDNNDERRSECLTKTNSEYICPIQFNRVGLYSVIVEVRFEGTILRSREKLPNVRGAATTKLSLIALALTTLPQPVNESTLAIPRVSPKFGDPRCLITLLGNESSGNSNNNEIPILTLYSDLIVVVAEYTEDNPESFPNASVDVYLLKMAANVAILKYLKATSPKSEHWAQLKAKAALEILYQNLLSFRRKDGSFAEFGWKSESGSIGLTAWVVQTLVDAREFTFIDENVIREGLHYLHLGTYDRLLDELETSSLIQLDGVEKNHDVTLVANVLVTFLKASKFPNNSSTIKLLRQYLRSNFNTSETTFYDKTLIAYSEHIWEENNPGEESQSSKYMSALWESWLGNGTAHELSTQRFKLQFHSYRVLMNYHRQFNISVIEEGNEILRLLKSESDFISAYDTTVAITALAKIAEKKQNSIANYTISAYAIGQNSSATQVLDNQRLNSELQSKSVVLPKGTKQVCIDGNGRGLIFAQLVNSYDVGYKNISGGFDFKFDAVMTEKQDLNLKFSARKTGGVPSKMAVAEVNLPTGFNFIQSQTDRKLRNVTSIKAWQYLNRNSKMKINFESVPHDVSIEFNLFAGKMVKVTNLAMAYVKIYESRNLSSASQIVYKV